MDIPNTTTGTRQKNTPKSTCGGKCGPKPTSLLEQEVDRVWSLLTWTQKVMVIQPWLYSKGNLESFPQLQKLEAEEGELITTLNTQDMKSEDESECAPV